MSMEEEEDKLLLNSLGVTSANPEDIERDVLTEVKNETGGANEAADSTDMQFLHEEQGTESSVTTRSKIFNKLRAVQVEIDAVAASVEQTRNAAINESVTSDGTDGEAEDLDSSDGIIQDSSDGLKLQHALALDRLRSLKKTKALLQKDLNELSKNSSAKDVGDDKLLDKLVREETKQKRKLKEVDSSSKNSKRWKKSLAFGNDIDFEAMLGAASAGFVETERDELIRKGVLTPFHKIKGFERCLQQPEPSSKQDKPKENPIENAATAYIARAVQSSLEVAKARPTTKLLDAKDLPKLEAPTHPFRRLKPPLKLPRSPGAENLDDKKSKPRKRKRPLPDKRWRKAVSKEEKLFEGTDAGEDSITSDYEEENQGEDEPAFVTLEGGLKIPETIFSQLFDYQKVGVQWLWELHCQRAGGIIGDEMGLGKTIQVLSFLGALHFSKMYKPSIIICPVTLLQQWKREAKKWYPNFRVEILHDSVQIPDKRRKQEKSDGTDEETDDSLHSDNERSVPHKTAKKWDFLINRVLRSESGLLITSYEQLRILGENLLDIGWGYAVLDEGHRIRNPNAEITLVCKQLQTVHRIIMTGAPIQNKLSELWSLFDFVFPGKLGVLPVFETEFAVPISVGGYANATPLQVSTAYRCAIVLRDLIMPYLLRRMKADVNAQLPKKTEHVLFCSLTTGQKSAYRAFLASSEVEQIFDGNRNSLYGIDIMRKICNHPDLLERDHCANDPDYGNPERSGKMKVLEQVLKVWKGQGHRVLLFTQTQQMLDIIENFLLAVGYIYRRMDGVTPVKQRTSLMDEFNNSTEVFIFILTTKVGGLGTNLTGANRVIIFDPDWNPSTDMQARERAWRIGQKRDVVVYRLITRGTIEEKVYHRQIYKHFLTNKILKNPQQKRFFKARDLRDLFTLQDEEENGFTETSNIFHQLADDVNLGIQENKLDKTGSATTAMHVNGGLCEKTSSEHQSSKGKEKVDASNGEVDEETNILRSLFDAQGIHSAINHDAIMSANDGEKMRMEEQASQVAKRAADALRQSRMLCNQENISVPTWTGRAGAAGAPSSVRKKFGSTINTRLLSSSKPSEGSSLSGGISKLNGLAAGALTGKALSSAELLAKIQGTQERAALDALEHQSASGSNHYIRPLPDVVPLKASHKKILEPDILVEQLITFIQCLGGSARSTDIVKHFKDKIPSEDLTLFKDLLKEIASLKRDSNGSTWILKPEYQQSPAT